ncbi:MAG: class I SAM-dependent methyltransferase [Verrucomicrobia bacterium]|jgi:hypothetical protein|nr:class I SAM-dependent methyltransferase [Verrucomicrobiota bacterium]MBT7067416.1 class I SAM-dependent methyltransferase [Verrucomicrobiota bacterium]MBT7700062.1 class I SAM-dependent methyltransferase [Verrucomicrobiota bacterium]
MSDGGVPEGSDRFSLRDWRQDSAKQKIKRLIGAVLVRLFPRRAAMLRENSFTHHGRRLSLLNRMIGAGIGYGALQAGDYETLGEYHRNFWGGQHAKAYHDDAPERFESVFLRYYTPLIDELERCLATRGGVPTLCEIGSGAGLMMDYLARRFKAVKRLIGVDLDAVTTAAARQAFPDPRMEFVAADALDYIEQNGQPDWVFLTQNGVLEYFPPDALDRFFRLVAGLAPAAVALIEPVARNHDLATRTESTPYGQEFGFSHNYPHRLAQHGFQVLYQHEERVFGMRTLMILATIDPGAEA